MAVFSFFLFFFFPRGIERHLKDSSLLEEVERSEQDRVARMQRATCSTLTVSGRSMEGGFLSSLKCRIYNITTIKL